MTCKPQNPNAEDVRREAVRVVERYGAHPRPSWTRRAIQTAGDVAFVIAIGLLVSLFIAALLR